METVAQILQEEGATVEDVYTDGNRDWVIMYLGVDGGLTLYCESGGIGVFSPTSADFVIPNFRKKPKREKADQSAASDRLACIEVEIEFEHGERLE